METRHRRTVARLIRFGLIALAVVLVAVWVRGRIPERATRLRVQEAPAVDELAPGDLRIVSVDSAMDVVLHGDRILTGLSPHMVAKVRAEMEKSEDTDTAGLGGSIARAVKSTVADKIGMHLAYNLDDISDIRFDDGRLILHWKRGGEQRLLGNVKVDNNPNSGRFHERDARQLIDAFRARQ